VSTTKSHNSFPAWNPFTGETEERIKIPTKAFVCFLRLCKVKRSLPCYNDQQTDLTSFVHALVYNSSFYKGNSHQSIQFYP
jgi:hypothetical protein